MTRSELECASCNGVRQWSIVSRLFFSFSFSFSFFFVRNEKWAIKVDSRKVKPGKRREKKWREKWPRAEECSVITELRCQSECLCAALENGALLYLSCLWEGTASKGSGIFWWLQATQTVGLLHFLTILLPWFFQCSECRKQGPRDSGVS